MAPELVFQGILSCRTHPKPSQVMALSVLPLLLCIFITCSRISQPVPPGYLTVSSQVGTVLSTHGHLVQNSSRFPLESPYRPLLTKPNSSPWWLLALLLCGDDSPNPGPPTKPVCPRSDRVVCNTVAALQCDGCDKWLHRGCEGVLSLSGVATKRLKEGKSM